MRATTKKGRQLFSRKEVHPGDLAGGFSDLEMTWLVYCAGAATGKPVLISRPFILRDVHTHFFTSIIETRNAAKYFVSYERLANWRMRVNVRTTMKTTVAPVTLAASPETSGV